MATKEKLKTKAARLREEARETGRVVLRAPALVRLAECLIRFLLGALLAGAEIFGGYAPFALALVGAALAFTISRTTREAEITAYYEYLDQADAASSMEKSLALLQQAVESDPDNPDAYLAIAALYLRQGLREESARYLQEEILPRFPDIYQNEAFLELVGELDTAD